ncbi:hypothetical protein BJ165DRAFT_1477452 [Panaeolus papilionaceus]|nr:hypothetical protein BJ165DRAFT_1477452 [Panaeolus papilionaceus]
MSASKIGEAYRVKCLSVGEIVIPPCWGNFSLVAELHVGGAKVVLTMLSLSRLDARTQLRCGKCIIPRMVTDVRCDEERTSSRAQIISSLKSDQTTPTKPALARVNCFNLVNCGRIIGRCAFLQIKLVGPKPPVGRRWRDWTQEAIFELLSRRWTNLSRRYLSRVS